MIRFERTHGEIRIEKGVASPTDQELLKTHLPVIAFLDVLRTVHVRPSSASSERRRKCSILAFLFVIQDRTSFMAPYIRGCTSHFECRQPLLFPLKVVHVFFADWCSMACIDGVANREIPVLTQSHARELEDHLCSWPIELFSSHCNLKSNGNGKSMIREIVTKRKDYEMEPTLSLRLVDCYDRSRGSAGMGQ